MCPGNQLILGASKTKFRSDAAPYQKQEQSHRSLLFFSNHHHGCPHLHSTHHVIPVRSVRPYGKESIVSEMSNTLYKDAGTALDQCLAGRATAKSASLNNRVKNKRATYAIVVEALKCNKEYNCCLSSVKKPCLTTIFLP